MRKNNKLLVGIFLSLVIVFLLTSCKTPTTAVEKEHVCSFSQTYKSNELYHWTECECGEKTEYIKHNFDEGQNDLENSVVKYTCQTCGYVKEEHKDFHTCSFEMYRNNNAYHWLICNCGKASEREKHTFDEGKVDLENLLITYTCSLCGYQKQSNYQPPHECSYEKWIYSSEYHWQECECGNVSKREEHNFDSGVIEGDLKTYTCSDCGYSYSETYISSHTHAYDGYLSDENYHWQKCECGNTTIKTEHNFDFGVIKGNLKVFTCQTCGYEKEENAHVCAFDKWAFSAEYHWKICSCGQTTDRSKHNFDLGSISVSPTENTEGIKVYTCRDCNYSYEEVIPPSTHVCEFDEEWYFDPYFHWLECECGEILEEESHTWDSGVVITAATCKADGQTRYTCIICQNIKIVQTEKTEHTYEENAYMFDNYLHWYECDICGEILEEDSHHWDSGKVLTSPTCSKTGSKEYTCSDCGKKKTESIDKIEHSYGEIKTDNKYHWYECGNCGHLDQLTEHNFNEGTVIKNASCFEVGMKELTCQTCLKVKNVEIEKTSHTYQVTFTTDESNHWYKCENCDAKSNVAPHSFGEGVVVKNPTETEEGLKEYTCTICSYVKQEILGTSQHTHTFDDTLSFDEFNHWYQANCGHDLKEEVEAHSWNKGSVTAQPTCHSVGIKTYKCYTCAATKTEEIAMTSHSYSDSWLNDNIGHWHKCENCDDVTEKILHNWNSGKITSEATEYEEGEILYTCIDCSYTKTESIPKLPHTHNYAIEFSNDNTSHWHECRCGEKNEVENHKYGNPVILQAATCESEGLKKYTCSVCQYSYEEKIEKLPHTFGDVWYSDYKYHWHECIKCGAKEKDIAHSNGSTTILVNATTRREGVTVSTCTVCNSESFGVIAKLTEKREARSTSTVATIPSNESLEPTFDVAPSGYVYASGNDLYMKSSGYSMKFVYVSGKYKVEYLDANGTKRFQMNKPATVYICAKIGSAPEKLNALYDSVTVMEYGLKAIATLTSSNGTVIRVEDKYYYPADTFVENALANAGALHNFLPAIIFLVACGIAFATGTSWGTFGILIPIVLSVFPTGSELMVIGMSACLAGAVCGDHCSPISDTTIMASTGGACNHIDHVKTQLPYALTIAGIAVISYVVAGFVSNLGFVWSGVIMWAVAAVLFVGAIFLIKYFNKKAEAVEAIKTVEEITEA